MGRFPLSYGKITVQCDGQWDITVNITVMGDAVFLLTYAFPCPQIPARASFAQPGIFPGKSQPSVFSILH